MVRQLVGFVIFNIDIFQPPISNSVGLSLAGGIPFALLDGMMFLSIVDII
jgi:hypothetical protein